MQRRGARPLKDDGDCRLGYGRGVWYGWPDFCTDGTPVSDPLHQPPIELLARSGYTDLSALIDQEASGLPLNTGSQVAGLVAGKFPSMSGAAKLDFAPSSGPFA